MPTASQPWVLDRSCIEHSLASLLYQIAEAATHMPQTNAPAISVEVEMRHPMLTVHGVLERKYVVDEDDFLDPICNIVQSTLQISLLISGVPPVTADLIEVNPGDFVADENSQNMPVICDALRTLMDCTFLGNENNKDGIAFNISVKIKRLDFDGAELSFAEGCAARVGPVLLAHRLQREEEEYEGLGLRLGMSLESGAKRLRSN